VAGVGVVQGVQELDQAGVLVFARAVVTERVVDASEEADVELDAHARGRRRVGGLVGGADTFRAPVGVQEMPARHRRGVDVVGRGEHVDADAQDAVAAVVGAEPQDGFARGPGVGRGV
jgi:hypothetical protein